MSTMAPSNDRDRHEDRTLIIQSGIERSNTIDLLSEARPDTSEIVDDVYEAVARIGLSSSKDRIRTVLVPLTIPEYAPNRIVQAFRRVDGRLRLVLLAPTGRAEACSAALRAGFDAILEIPTSVAAIESILNGQAPAPSSQAPPTTAEASKRTPPQETEPVPTEFEPPEATPSRAPAIDDAELGDIDLVDSLLVQDGRLRETAIRMMRTHLGTDDVHLVLPEDAWNSDGRAEAEVRREDRIHGTLVSGTIGIEDLERWAEWLSRWMELDWTLMDLAHQAETDELTGAGNRRGFERVLRESIEAARAERQLLTLMVFDIDNFKTYNDQFGHEAGDEVLRETVQLLRATIRRGDHVFRIGGDEFVVIFSDNEGPRGEESSPPESVEQIAHRFQAQVCDMRFPKLGVDAPGSLSISAGLATFPWDGHDATSLLRHADQLALDSKRAGKNLITFGPGARRPRKDP
ncbi:MAG: diguanylate cyclase [Phycisphaerales bacterium]|nr:diguanylate cyclase [Phycisphaerales bacterium]